MVNTPTYCRPYIHQAETWYWLLLIIPPSSTESPGSTTRIDEELALKLVSFEFVCSSPQKHVHVHLSSSNQQGICISLRYDCMSMCKAYAHISVLDDFRQCQIRCVDIVVAFD